MGMSLTVAAVIIVLHGLAFALAFGAERRRSTGRPVPDEYDERTFCVYDSDASTVYGLAAFGLLVVSQVVVTVVTRCLCLGRGPTTAASTPGGRRGPCAVTCCIFSCCLFLALGLIGYWAVKIVTAVPEAVPLIGLPLLKLQGLLVLTFLIAEACLLAGSARNAYHTKYVGYYAKHDLLSCAELRKGVFAAAAAMILLSLLASLLLYWVYSKSDIGGWQRHTNEEGLRMQDYNSSQKDANPV